MEGGGGLGDERLEIDELMVSTVSKHAWLTAFQLCGCPPGWLREKIVDLAEEDVAVSLAMDWRERRLSSGEEGEREEMSCSRGRDGRGAVRNMEKTLSLVVLTMITKVVRERAAIKRDREKKLLMGARGRLEEIARDDMK